MIEVAMMGSAVAFAALACAWDVGRRYVEAKRFNRELEDVLKADVAELKAYNKRHAEEWRQVANSIAARTTAAPRPPRIGR